MSTKTIKNKIVEYMEEITGDDKLNSIVYGYFESMPQKTPSIQVYLGGFDQTRLSFQENQANNVFTIKLCIFQPENADMAELEDLRIDCIDDITNRLTASDALETLGGETFETSIEAGEPYLDNDTQMAMLVTDITFATSTCKLIVAP